MNFFVDSTFVTFVIQHDQNLISPTISLDPIPFMIIMKMGQR
jgi:hypothetical protein